MNWHAFDERFHGELKKKAENLKDLTIENCEYLVGKIFHSVKIKKENEKYEKNGFLYLKGDDFDKIFLEYPKENEISEVEENENAFIIKATFKKNEKEIEAGIISFQKTDFYRWFIKETVEKKFVEPIFQYSMPNSFKRILYNFDCDVWIKIKEFFPEPRIYHTAVWTGVEMIIWGGYNGSFINTGGRYQPLTDTWIPTSLENAPSPRILQTVVWTGTEMIIWGGQSKDGPPLNNGGRYNPSTDSWVSTSATNAPSGRKFHTAVWTGNEMIIWDGYPYTQTGGVYKVHFPVNFANIYPENNSTNQRIDNLLIDWLDSNNATSYDLYLVTINPPLLYQSNIQESQFIVNELLSGATYYWYVVAKSSCGTNMSMIWSFATFSLTSPKIIPDGSGPTAPMTVIKTSQFGTELQVSWDEQCNPHNANIIYGYLAQISNYTIGNSKCHISNPDIWNIGEVTNIWFLIVSDNNSGTESSWGYNSSGHHRNGTNASYECVNCSRDNSGTCP